MRFPVLAGAALLALNTAATAELLSPKVTITQVDWAAAAASLPERGDGDAAAAFARANAESEKRYPGIGKSSVPVLLPVDLGPFQPTKYFLPGPAGYTGTFILNHGDGGFKFQYKRKPVEIEITGAGFTYDLDGPDRHEAFPAPKELQDAFPGIRRILHEAHVRYVFERFGVPYVVSIQCYDRRPSSRYPSCREVDPVAVKFLQTLRTVGGAPQTIAEPKLDLTQPDKTSDFTYYGPGDLIPNSGWRKMPGTADYTVYAAMRFPIADAPAYVKSQSFMPWGDCYKSGKNGRTGRKNVPYSCKVNGIPLLFNEAAAVNFTYPWRDNFCELRDFLVGQCAGGYGHQGQDIRPATCVQKDVNADRCLPYHHTIAAARDGLIWRMPGNLGAYIVINTPNEFVRFRYLHLNPHYMDSEGLITGRQVSEGEIIGKVATWGDFEKGTSYHLHFNMQVFTKVGWAWVNPYMSLVLSYERMIGGKGTEIKPGDPAPVIPDKPPVILNPPLPGEAKAAEDKPVQAKPAEAKSRKKARRPVRKKRR
ncbi:MAG: peptidoglycan DD-metalloendopeptidase family protein [Pseudolabrys sp.]|nr:peptidoglycan DD-metalloendopeptidase family protein [Pseudolabrys sp.]